MHKSLQDYLAELKRLGIKPKECEAVPWYMSKPITVVERWLTKEKP